MPPQLRPQFGRQQQLPQLPNEVIDLIAYHNPGSFVRTSRGWNARTRGPDERNKIRDFIRRHENDGKEKLVNQVLMKVPDSKLLPLIRVFLQDYTELHSKKGTKFIESILTTLGKRILKSFHENGNLPDNFRVVIDFLIDNEYLNYVYRMISILFDVELKNILQQQYPIIEQTYFESSVILRNLLFFLVDPANNDLVNPLIADIRETLRSMNAIPTPREQFLFLLPLIQYLENEHDPFFTRTEAFKTLVNHFQFPLSSLTGVNLKNLMVRACVTGNYELLDFITENLKSDIHLLATIVLKSQLNLEDRSACLERINSKLTPMEREQLLQIIVSRV